jgi:hypothetical protein
MRTVRSSIGGFVGLMARMRQRAARMVLYACAAAALAVVAAPATAQDGIALEWFGAGGMWRPGDWVGARFTVRCDVDESTPAQLVWEVRDGQGDIAEHERRIVVDPGSTTRAWMYAQLPPASQARMLDDAVMVVRVYEERNGARVRELAAARISPRSAEQPNLGVEVEHDLIGVIGQARMGLDALATPYGGTPYIPSMNSITAIGRGLRPSEMPDRWEGLASFGTLIWTEGSPAALSGDAARAVQEWVLRGGTLVIVLPETGDPWGVVTASDHPLRALMPDWRADRLDAVAVKELMPIISKSAQLANPSATTPLVVFREAKSAGSAWDPLVLMPVKRARATGLPEPRADSLDGAVLGVQRTWGYGQVTVLGLDVDALHRRALQPGGLPQADIFWNRILARRADAPSAADYDALRDAKPSRLLEGTPASTDLGRGELVSSIIGMRGQAALGILGAFGLFLTYWLVAGPAGFALLKWKGWERHAWVAFAVTALAFGAGAWAFGGLMRSTQVRVQHLTVLDAVRRPAAQERRDEPVYQRASVWFSAFLPGYGRTPISIEGDAPVRNWISTWSPPPMGSIDRFPDSARYSVPLDKPATLDLPARATSSELSASWLGVVDSRWGSLPAADDARPLVQDVIPGAPPRVRLSGVLSHALPATLRDVRLLYVSPLRSPLPRFATRALPLIEPSAALPNLGRFAIIPEWPAGKPIEIAEVLFPGGPDDLRSELGSIADGIAKRYADPFIEDRFGVRMTGMIAADRERLFLDMLGLYHMLQPPQYVRSAPPGASSPEGGIGVGNASESVRASRVLGREIDLSPWLTRPCLIVWGYLDAAECPVPITIDGERPPSSGLVVVRCVFPLPADARFAAPEAR